MKATITINNKTVNIEITAEQAKELGLVEDKKTGWERAKKSNMYYLIYPSLGIKESKENDDAIEDSRYKVGNYFKDRTLAEKMAKCISLMLRMQRWADEHNEPIDWKNEGKSKYYIKYDHGSRGLYLVQSCTYQSAHEVYFSSDELAEEAIKIFGEEIKEVLGVR